MPAIRYDMRHGDAKDHIGIRRYICIWRVFDNEFREASKAFIDAVVAGRFTLVTSELVRQEITAAPQRVRQLFDDMLPVADIARLAPKRSSCSRHCVGAIRHGCTPCSLATVSGASMIVSWNFRHIVNFQKIPKYNAVNRLHAAAILPYLRRWR